MIENSIQLLLFLLFLMFLLGSWRDLKKRGISVWGLMLLSIALFGWLGAFKYQYIDQGARGDFGSETEVVAYILVFVSHLMVILSYKAFKYSKVNSERYISISSFGLGVVFAISVICIIGNWLIPPFGGVQTLGKGVLQGGAISCIYYCLIAGARKEASFISVIFVTLIFTEAYTSRRYFISVFVPLLFIWLHFGHFDKKSVFYIPKKKVLAYLPFVALGFFAFLVAMRADQNFGPGYREGDYLGNFWRMIINLRNFDTFWNSAFVIDRFGDSFSYLTGSTYFSVLVAAWPRSLWLEKPVSFGAPLGYMVRTGREDFTLERWEEINQFSLSPGIVGEAYANFGVFGCVIIPVLIGVLAKIVQVRIHTAFWSSRLLYILTLPIFFLIFRGDFYSSVNFSLFLILGAFVFSKIIKRVCRIQ